MKNRGKNYCKKFRRGKIWASSDIWANKNLGIHFVPKSVTPKFFVDNVFYFRIQNIFLDSKYIFLDSKYGFLTSLIFLFWNFNVSFFDFKLYFSWFKVTFLDKKTFFLDFRSFFVLGLRTEDWKMKFRKSHKQLFSNVL